MSRFARWIALLLALGGSSAAFAQLGSMSGFCTQGGSKAAVSGLQSTNYQQGIIPSCTVSVYLTGTQTLATIYANGSSTPLTNPFTGNTAGSSAPGQWTFFAANNQQYDVTLSGGIPPNTYSTPVTVVTNGGVSGSFGNYLPLAGGTLYGAFFGPNINGELYPAQCGSATPPSWCSGTTAGQWILSACAQLPASGGMINFLGLVGTIANQVPCSTASKQVIFIADNTSSELIVTESDGLTVFPLDNASAIIGQPGGQCLNDNGFKLAATANITSLFGSAHTDGDQENFTVSGVCMHGYPGATVTKGMIYPSHVFTNTTITNNNVLQCPGDCILSEGVGGSEIITGNEFDATEGNPAIIGGAIEVTAAGVNGCGTSNIFIGYGDAEHSNGKPEINIHGDGLGALVCWVHIDHMYLEKSAVGTFNTAGISISDCWGCSVEDVQILGGDGIHTTGAGIKIAYTNNSTWTQQVRLQNIDVGPGAYANTLIDTSPGGTTLSSFSTPFIDQYTANPGYQKLFPPAQSTLQSLGTDVLGGIGNFNTGSANFGTGFGSAGCQPVAGTTCIYTRTNTSPAPNQAYSQEVQITANTNPGGVNGIETTSKYSFTAGQAYLATFWAKGDGTFTGFPLFYLGDFVGNNYCQSVAPASFPAAWTLYTFYCTPTTSATSNLTIGSETPANATGAFWFGGFTFTPVQPMPIGSLLQSVTPYGIGPASTAQQTITINSVPCQLGLGCSVSASGVPTVNGNPGPLIFSFAAGAGSITYSGGTSTVTISGSGTGGGSVTNFIANAGSWPTWCVPSVATSTTTPTLSVTCSNIPNSALANPSLTLGSTPLTLGATTSAVTGLQVNGVTLSTSAGSGNYLSGTGAYTAPSSAPSGAAGGVLSGSYPNPGIATQVPVINGVVYSKGFTGTTLAERWNSCLTAAQGLTSGSQTGYCDASADNGAFTTDTEIEVGSSSGVAVGLVLPCQAVIKGGMTDGTSAIINFWSGASVRNNCPASGLNDAMSFSPTSTSNLGYLCKTTTVAGGPYISLEGFNCTNIAGGHVTASGIGFYLNGPQNDGSTLSFVNVDDSLDTYAAKAYNISAATTWQHSSINAAGGGTPFWASTDSGGYTQSLTMRDMTIVHAGTGLPEILCTDTRVATPHISELLLDHVYTETGTDGVTADVQSQGCGKIADIDHTFKSQSSGRTAYAYSNTSAYNTNFEIIGPKFLPGSGNYTYPANVINNANTSETQQTDSLGNYGLYNPPSVPSSLGVLTLQSLIVKSVSTVASTSPICPNGTGGALTIVGCTGGSGSTGFPIILGSTSIGATSTNTALAGLTVNGVILNSTGSATLFLNQAGAYVSPTATTPWASVTTGGANAVTSAFSTAAPWTFSAAGAASIPGLLVSGAPYTAGSATTNTPQLYVNSGTAPGSWSTAGTLIGGNAPSGFTGNIIDFYVNGVQSLMHLSYTGSLTTYGSISSRGANLLQTAVASTVPLTVSNTTTATADLQDWDNNGSIVASINDVGVLTTTGIVDSGITTSPSTAPICPNGSGGAFTTSGCNLGTLTICSGTVALGTSLITSGAAASTVTATCTGLAATDNIELDFNSSPLAVTGYIPSTSGMLTIIKWPTTNTINISVVNNTGASVTPGAITLNYHVHR